MITNKRNGGTPPGGDVGGPDLPVETEHLKGYGASMAEAKRGYGIQTPAAGEDPIDDFLPDLSPRRRGFLGEPDPSFER